MDTTIDMRSQLTRGARVEVRCRSFGLWSRGFEIAEPDHDGGYRVRRLSDDVVLPVAFSPDDLRADR